MLLKNFKNLVQKLSLFFLILSLYSCERKSELIVAQTKINDNIFGYSRILKLYSDSTFQLSDKPQNKTFKKDTIFIGKYSIVKDTIYFLDKIYNRDKAILQKGYLEILSTSPMKFELLKNKSTISSDLYAKTNSDFTFFTYTKEYFGKDLIGKNSSLNNNEILKVRRIIQSIIKKNRGDFYSGLNENDYYKQCVVIINSKNEKEIKIDCLAKEFDFETGVAI